MEDDAEKNPEFFALASVYEDPFFSSSEFHTSLQRKKLQRKLEIHLTGKYLHHNHQNDYKHLDSEVDLAKFQNLDINQQDEREELVNDECDE